VLGDCVRRRCDLQPSCLIVLPAEIGGPICSKVRVLVCKSVRGRALYILKRVLSEGPSSATVVAADTDRPDAHDRGAKSDKAVMNI
jgi:hypothetical protein